ncbi:MAG: hypothetical protein RR505_15010, partial [Raoultibacter sp.]
LAIFKPVHTAIAMPTIANPDEINELSASVSTFTLRLPSLFKDSAARKTINSISEAIIKIMHKNGQTGIL